MTPTPSANASPQPKTPAVKSGETSAESPVCVVKRFAARNPSPRPMASATSEIPIASLTMSAAMRRPGHPTARRIPISRTRSNTDIAIVFVTPMPPTMSASTEITQPTSMMRRDDVSTFTAWPGSTTAVMP
ncbi:MAG: hypothetical protein E6F98_10545 [Actinobacteria bacterium]|nr:MAG: hypothetical protein E6F98_10545 [Actinomycetota bacterium]